MVTHSPSFNGLGGSFKFHGVVHSTPAMVLQEDIYTLRSFRKCHGHPIEFHRCEALVHLTMAKGGCLYKSCDQRTSKWMSSQRGVVLGTLF